MKRISKNVKVCTALVAALLSLSANSANGHAFNEKDAAAKWDAVKGSRSESSFLINLFLTEDMPGEFPHQVRARLREIATASDAELLLKMLIDPSKKEQHVSVYTLLKECKGDDHVALFEHYFGLVDNQDVRNELFNLITERNSPAAFAAATRILDALHTRGQHDEAIGFLDYMVRFNNPEIRQDVISGISSSSEIIKAASYVALRNYPDEEVEAIVNDAMVSEHTKVEGEKKFQAARSRSVQSSDYEQSSLIQNILKTTKQEMETGKLKMESEQKKMMNRTEENPAMEQQVQAAVSANSSDYELAKTYAPQLRLSGPGAMSLGVNLKLANKNYPYTDYIPIDVHDISSNKDKIIQLYYDNSLQIDLKDGRYIDTIGSPVYNKKSSWLDFSPIWGKIETEKTKLLIELGYKTLILRPTVYFKVFRDTAQKNPIAIQYWFFYFYNDWINDHPGDWETITVFLNNSAKAAEVAYSTHYEARRYLWKDADVNPVVYISNGGHGSYSHSGNTTYKNVIPANDNHLGDKEQVDNKSYGLVDLKEVEGKKSSWIWFEGNWGNDGSSNGASSFLTGAPRGPLFRTDAPTGSDWNNANNPPRDPSTCKKRLGAAIYSPWNWASGYGLDISWSKETGEKECKIPRNVKATDGEYADKVRVTWDTVLWATSYQVFRCTGAAADNCIKYDASSSPYDEKSKDLVPGKLYAYKVKACKGKDERKECSEDSTSDSGHIAQLSSVSVSHSNGSWNSSPQYLNVSSAGATAIYYTMSNKTDGTDPPDPPKPSRTSSKLPGDSVKFRLYNDAAVLKKSKLRFIGCNNVGCGPASGVYSYQIDLRPSIPVLAVNGAAASGSISPAGDADWYKFAVPSAGIYTIETWAGSLMDNYMYLYGPNNKTSLIEEDDDDGNGYAAKIVRRLSAGTYYVKVRAYSSTGTGAYTIKITKSTGNVPGSASASPSSGSWTRAPQNLNITSSGAATIYFTMVNTYDGSTPADPAAPSLSSNNGSMAGPSGTFQLHANSGQNKKSKLRFIGCNNVGCGPASPVYSYQIDRRMPAPGGIAVSPASGSWTSTPHYLNVSSGGATAIYYTMINTTDGSTPADPSTPSPSSNHGKMTGSSAKFEFYNNDTVLKRSKLRFIGCNSSGCGPVSGVHSYQIDRRIPTPGGIAVSPDSGSWTSTPQYLNVSSGGATVIYFKMANTYNGSTPDDPSKPSPSSNDGSLSGPSAWFELYNNGTVLKRSKLRFIGCNSSGCGPASGVYSYQIDRRLPPPGGVSVSPDSGRWTKSPQYLKIKSDGATVIYFKMANTYDGSTPGDPSKPSPSSNNGSFSGPSAWFELYARSGQYKKSKLRFIGCNSSGCGPASGIYSYRIDRR